MTWMKRTLRTGSSIRKVCGPNIAIHDASDELAHGQIEFSNAARRYPPQATRCLATFTALVR